MYNKRITEKKNSKLLNSTWCFWVPQTHIYEQPAGTADGHGDPGTHWDPTPGPRPDVTRRARLEKAPWLTALPEEAAPAAKGRARSQGHGRRSGQPNGPFPERRETSGTFAAPGAAGKRPARPQRHSGRREQGRAVKHRHFPTGSGAIRARRADAATSPPAVLFRVSTSPQPPRLPRPRPAALLPRGRSSVYRSITRSPSVVSSSTAMAATRLPTAARRGPPALGALWRRGGVWRGGSAAPPSSPGLRGGRAAWRRRESCPLEAPHLLGVKHTKHRARFP